MKRMAIVVIAALMLLAAPASSEPVKGITVNKGPACEVSDLSTESMALISRWAMLSRKLLEPGPQGTLTDAELLEGQAIEQSGRCGNLKGDVPIVIVLSDGALNLGMFPDGQLLGLPAESFQRIIRLCAPYGDEGEERCINIRE